MHPDCHALHSLLTLENEINRAGEQIDECVAIRRCQEYPAQLELHHLAHCLHGYLDLRGPVPVAFPRGGFRLGRFPSSPCRGSLCRLLCSLNLDSRQGPLK